VKPEPLRVEVPSGEARMVHADDVDDVIGIAAELRQREESLLTVEDMKEVARELDLEDRFVDRAIAELDARRLRAREAAEAERRVAAEKAARLKRVATIAAVAVACIVLVTFGGACGAASTMRTELAEVERTRAQVKNVVERRASVEARWRDAPDGIERNAELSGAENRVSIEKRRYDEAAARYNAGAGGTMAGLASGLYGLPKRVPLSSEIDTW
jgi:hypothetical protein